MTPEDEARAAAEKAGGEYRPRYAGWKNRETWNTALWIDNEQAWNEEAREIVRTVLDEYDPTAGPLADVFANDTPEQHRERAIRDAAEALGEWWEEDIHAIDEAGPVSDAWAYALAWVDWYSIAEGYAAEWPSLPHLTPDTEGPAE